MDRAVQHIQGLPVRVKHKKAQGDMPVYHWRATWISSPSVLQHRVEANAQKKEATRLLEQRKEALAEKKKENAAKKEAKGAEKEAKAVDKRKRDEEVVT